MKDLAYFTEQARRSYRAYGEVTDFKNYQGLPMPEWDDLTVKIQQAWVNAVKQIFRDLQVRDTATNELFVED